MGTARISRSARAAAPSRRSPSGESAPPVRNAGPRRPWTSGAVRRARVVERPAIAQKRARVLSQQGLQLGRLQDDTALPAPADRTAGRQANVAQRRDSTTLSSVTLETTLHTASELLASHVRSQLRLRWLFPNPERPVVPVLEGFRLGRDPSCLVLLDGEGVSRVHAEVARQGKGFVLRDAGSTNGTYLNGERITEAVSIDEGAIVRFGGWLGVFERCSAATPGVGVHEIAPGLLGGSVLVDSLEAARRVAPSELPIVIRGETGTGKEVVSRAIHAWSGRTGSLCAVNCSALPQHLVEGELFGYRRGAFTGAERNSPGYFRAAHGGTLLLDEINELPLGVQAKLLRVLQERQVVPLGEVTPVNVDVRIVVAAQSPLSTEVAEGRFREDLYMRLKGLEVELPPLRDRPGDAAELFQCFVRQARGQSGPRVDAKLLEALCLHGWPGNVRELMLLTQRLLAVHGHEPVLGRQHLPAEMTQPKAASATGAGGEPPLTRLGKALLATDGNLTRACAALGISRQRAYRLLDGLSTQELMARTKEPGASDGA